MKILITPNDIIERCLFDDFEYYCLDKSVNREEFIANNEEFEIDEKDALVMGLMKCIETNNLSHRLNQYIQHFVSNRAITIEKKYFIKKKALLEEILKFNKKFPPTWKPNIMYEKSLTAMQEYMDYLVAKIDTLKITSYTDKFGTYEVIEHNHLKKSLKHHN
jgi:hypothetical protein